MILTEHEAREKWCPFARAVVGKTGTECIASQCMAWDWEDDVDEYRSVDLSVDRAHPGDPLHSEFERPAGDGWDAHGAPFRPSGFGTAWRAFFKRPWGERRRGFCGLARRADVRVDVQQP